MTSVPTWLAVLVPLLAAAVSGSAGIAGALLGGRSAAALAREEEQRRWNRALRAQEEHRAQPLDRFLELVRQELGVDGVPWSP